MKLNTEQLAVVNAAIGSTDSLVVKSLAGTGKTTVLMELLRYLEGSIFLCAFGREATQQLRDRARTILPREFKSNGYSDRIDINTTNSLGMRTWMRANDSRKIQLDKNKVRILLDTIAPKQPLAAKYQGWVAKLVSHAKRAGLGVLSSIDKFDNWRELVSHYSMEADVYGDDDLTAELIGLSMSVYRLSLDQCRSVIDYDDQILAPMYYECRFKRYSNVLLDEAQDTSPLRLQMVLSLPTSDGRFIAVGDENQSIMGFTGAHNDSIAEIVSMTGGTVLRLNTTFRVPKSGVRLAQEEVPEFRAADSNDDGEVLRVVLEHTRDMFANPPDFWSLGPFTKYDAILCRNTRPLIDLAYKMISRKIPCKVEGRDIGASLVALARRWPCTDLYDLAAKVDNYKRREYTRLISQYKEQEAAAVEDRCETLITLIVAAISAGGTGISALLDLVQTIFGDTPDGREPEYCTLSTVHKAKGREWSRVFLLGLDQFMPSPYAKQPWELKQERNLIYVAKTRHKHTLVLVTMPEAGDTQRGKQ